jgi:hypothetical protein
MSELGLRAAAVLDWPLIAKRVDEWYRVVLEQRQATVRERLSGAM